VTQMLPAYASHGLASWVTLCVGLVCVGAHGPPGGARGPSFSYFTTAFRGYTTLYLSLSLSSCWSLSHLFSVLFYFIYSPFSSPSVRALPRGPALSSSDSSVPLPRSLGLFLPTPTGPLSPNLRATPHPVSSHFLFPCGDPLNSVPDTTAHISSCSRSRNTACLGSHIPPFWQFLLALAAPAVPSSVHVPAKRVAASYLNDSSASPLMIIGGCVVVVIIVCITNRE
jgi:hypothetical protein